MPPGGGRRCYLEGGGSGRTGDGRRAGAEYIPDCRMSAPGSLFGWLFGSLQSETGLPPVRMYWTTTPLNEAKRERERNSQKANFLFLFFFWLFLLLLFSFGVAPVERRYTKRESVLLLLLLCVSLIIRKCVCVWRRCVCVCFFFARFSFCYSLLPLVAVFPHVLSGN